MTKRRILFLNTMGIVGGQEVVMLDIVRGLDRLRYEPFAATLRPGLLVDTLRAERVETRVLPPHRIRQPLKFAAAIAALTQILVRERIDLVHCNGDVLLLYGVLAALPLRVPCVWHVYEPVDTSSSGFNRLVYHAQKRLRAAWTIFGTAAVEESYLRYYPQLGPHTPVMPGVDVDAVRRGADPLRARQRLGVSAEVPLLLAIGRVQRSKGHRELLEAVALLDRASPQPHVVVCGGPPVGTDADYPAALAELARARGLAERVHFVGQVSDADKHDLLSAATALVHPAHYEAFGIAVIEGMAAGRPVIVTDAIGPKSIVSGSGGGEIVPRRDVPALASALERLLSDPAKARRAGELGQAHVQRHYDRRVMVKRVAEIYDAVLASRGR